MKRLIVAAGVLGALTLCAQGSMTAQARYTYTVIARAGVDVAAAPWAPSINESGQVAFANGFVYRGDGGPLATLYSYDTRDTSNRAAGGPVSINDAGKVAFLGNSILSSSGVGVADGNTVSFVAGWPAWTPTGEVSINNHDAVVFVHQIPQIARQEVRLASGGTVVRIAGPGDVVPEGTLVNAGFATINDSGQVAFMGVLPGGVFSVYRAESGGGLTSLGGGLLGSIVADGRVAFWTYAYQGVVVGSGGPTQPILKPPSIRHDPWVASLNDHGDVAFNGTPTTGSVSGVYVGNTTDAWPVLVPGDVIPALGTVVSAVAGNEALNNRGQVAMLVQYTDAAGVTRQAIVRADPPDTDADDDGVPDDEDDFPNDPTESRDTDDDGIGNNADLDDDADGQSDADESACGSNPLDATSRSTDTDGDGRPDCVDVNRAPVANDNGIGYVEDAVPVRFFLTASDPDNDPLTFSFVRRPTIATVTMINASTGEFELAPNPNAFGDDTFTFQVSDGMTVSNVATVRLSLNPRNDAPVASNGALTVPANTPQSGTLQATDIENDQLSYAVVSPPGRGTVLITNAATGAYTYAPQTGMSGSDSFTFRANDGGLDSNIATVTVTITPPVVDTLPPDVLVLSPGPGTFITTAGLSDLRVQVADASGVTSVSYVLQQLCKPDFLCFPSTLEESGTLSLASGTAQQGVWSGSVHMSTARMISFVVTARDPLGNVRTAFAFADNDGIAPAVDLSPEFEDQSLVYSSEFNSGTTAGLIHRRTGLVAARLTANFGVQLEAVRAGDPAGPVPTWASVCAPSHIHVFLDRDRETINLRCDGPTVHAKAVVALPSMIVRKLVTNQVCSTFFTGWPFCFESTLWLYTDLTTGQGFTTGSPTTADPDNTEPLRVDVMRVEFDGQTTVVATFFLDPGESIDPRTVPGPAPGSESLVVDVLAGEVELRLNGETRIIRPGDDVQLIVTKAAQSISFETITDKIFGEGPFAVSVSASSGLPVSLSAAGACAVSQATVTITGVGTCTVTAAQGGDDLYEPAMPVSRSFGVTYAWSGVLSPLNPAGSTQKSGNNIPVKFQLTGPSAGANLQARLYISRPGVPETPASSTRPGDNLFRYDPGLQAWVLNWNTKSLALGTWTLRIDLGDGVVRTVQVTLVK